MSTLIILPNSSIVTLVTVIPYSFMYWLYISSKTTVLSSHIFTVVIVKHNSFMYSLYIIYKITLCRCSIFIIVTLITSSFINWLYVKCNITHISSSIITLVTVILSVGGGWIPPINERSLPSIIFIWSCKVRRQLRTDDGWLWGRRSRAPTWAVNIRVEYDTHLQIDLKTSLLYNLEFW